MESAIIMLIMARAARALALAGLGGKRDNIDEGSGTRCLVAFQNRRGPSNLGQKHQNRKRTVMNRRHFLAATALGAGTGISSIAMPAIAQSMPQIRWRLATSWPKSLDTLYGACEVFAKRVAEITDSRFQIQLFAAGEIVPGLAVLDAVQNQTVEIGSTAAYYYVGKDAALAFGTAVPFGLNARQMEAWLVHGGGNDLLQEVFA